MELWKRIGKTRYEVSNLGRVKVIDGIKDAAGRCRYAGKILQSGKRRGYPSLPIYGGEKVKYVAIHRLVAAYFLPKPPKEKTQVNHKNGIRDDNRVENLEYCTPSENIRHCIHVLKNNCGVKRYNAKLTEDDIREIRRLRASGMGCSEIGRKYDYSSGGISNICVGRAWAHVPLLP